MAFKKPAKSLSEVKVLAKDVEAANKAPISSASSAKKEVNKVDVKHQKQEEKSSKSSVAKPAKKTKKPSVTDNLVVHKLPRTDEWRGVAKEQIFLSAHLPAKGTSPTFDTMVGFYSERKALQMILRKAIVDYEHAIHKNRYKSLPKDYDRKEPQNKTNLVVTSRTMPIEIAQTARSFFDPMGFESNRAVGYKIATAALANFFQNETK